jgi:hypothetical protein
VPGTIDAVARLIDAVHSRVQSLSLGDNNLTAQGYFTLEPQLSRCSALRVLNVDKTALGTKGA